MPADDVYRVRPASRAAVAAARMCGGVGWSGSPTLKSRIRSPLAASAAARWAMATVGETSSALTRRERAGSLPLRAISPRGLRPRRAAVFLPEPSLDHRRDEVVA